MITVWAAKKLFQYASIDLVSKSYKLFELSDVGINDKNKYKLISMNKSDSNYE